MAIPKNITKQNILDALKSIDENGVPPDNQSTEYDLVTDDGKRYPPKYVIAVADQLANQAAHTKTDGFNSIEAKNFLENLGFKIESKQQEFKMGKEYIMTITKDSVTSTDNRFTMDDLGLGDNYEPVDAYYKKADGTEIRRAYRKHEFQISNQTMPRIACQIFEKQIDALSAEEKKNFPICKYNPNDEMRRGIFPNKDTFKNLEYVKYKNSNGDEKFVFYCWNIFSTIIFVQECIKRFGESDDKMVLVYKERSKEGKEKGKKESESEERGTDIREEPTQTSTYRNAFSKLLIKSKNIIFRGAPGTGKTYLAQEIAADIISNGAHTKIEELSDEEQKQYGFVQFHPSYDYSDFVEGLRPIIKNDSMVFELRDGIFKEFVNRARKNYENSKKTDEDLKKEISIQDSIEQFFSEIEFGVQSFRTKTGNEFTITGVDDKHINILIPGNAKKELTLRMDEVRQMLESNRKFNQIKDITNFFEKTFATQEYSYDYAIFKEIKKKKNTALKINVTKEKEKNYVFIIDEINRGEISKIFGELFFAIDPGYRGLKGKVSTQYEYMHDSDEKFYIPENVYIIGTMNDIDRSVDSFDFAMRRRFRFVELKASEQTAMLDANIKDEKKRNEAIDKMKKLNEAISETEGLNENYHIGPAYFLKLENLSPVELWDNCLEPLLEEYVRGMSNEKDCMNKFKAAYYNEKPVNGASDENQEDQG